MFFLLLFALISAGFVTTKGKFGFQKAMATWFPLVFLLMPVWINLTYSALLIDLRFAFFLLAVFFFFLEPPGKKTLGPTIADGLAVFLSLAIIFTQYRQGLLGPWSAPEILRKWLCPYLLGRWFAANWRNIGLGAKDVAWVLLCASVLAVLEAFLKVNLVQKATGKSFSLLEQGEGYRWGIKRAMGSLGHPIFFGMAMVCMLPWSILVFFRARNGQANKGWMAMPFIHLFTIIITASRGPQMCALMVLASIPYFRYRSLRVWIVLGALLTLVVAYTFREQALEILGSAAGEKSTSESRIILIEGEEFEYTGTAHRLLLFRVYREAIEKVGLFGYGTKFLEGMAKSGIGLPEDLEMRFGSIDNGYLLLLLQHGWLGVWALVAFATVVIYQGLALGMRVEGPLGVFAGTMTVSLLSLMIFLTSVWFCPDFSAFWLFNAGLIVSMAGFPPDRPTSGIGLRRSQGKVRPKSPPPGSKPRPPGRMEVAQAKGGWNPTGTKVPQKTAPAPLPWQQPGENTPHPYPWSEPWGMPLAKPNKKDTDLPVQESEPDTNPLIIEELLRGRKDTVHLDAAAVSSENPQPTGQSFMPEKPVSPEPPKPPEPLPAEGEKPDPLIVIPAPPREKVTLSERDSPASPPASRQARIPIWGAPKKKNPQPPPPDSQGPEEKRRDP